MRFTALVVAVAIRLTQTTNRTAPTTGPAKARSRAVSRVTEIAEDAGVAPVASGTSSTSRAKAVPMSPWRTILPAGLSPRFCFLAIFL